MTRKSPFGFRFFARCRFYTCARCKDTFYWHAHQIWNCKPLVIIQLTDKRLLGLTGFTSVSSLVERSLLVPGSRRIPLGIRFVDSNNPKPIQSLLPVDHSIAYNPTGTWEKHTFWSIRAWLLLKISGLSSSSTDLIATMAESSHSHKVLLKVIHIGNFRTFQYLPLVFQNGSRTFSVLWNLRTFQGWIIRLGLAIVPWHRRPLSTSTGAPWPLWIFLIIMVTISVDRQHYR